MIISRGGDASRVVRLRTGFTLLEASIALVVISILMGVAVTALKPNSVERVRATADLLAADLRLAQSLALRDATDFTLTVTDTGWKVEHTGTGTAPALPTPLIGGTGSGYEINASSIIGQPISLQGRLLPSRSAVMSVTFTSTGRTRAVEGTEFWITTGAGDHVMSMSLTIAPYTGMVTEGVLVKGAPN